MAIRKMKFVSIVGALEDFDEFVSNYITDSDLHLENALGVMGLVRGLVPFADEGARGDMLQKSCAALMDAAGIDYGATRLEEHGARQPIAIDAIERELAELDRAFQEWQEDLAQARDRIMDCELMIASLKNILDVSVNVEQFFDLEYVRFRFGKIPKNALKTLNDLTRDLDIALIPVSSDDKHCWLIYFTPSSCREKVDGVVSSMQFERTRLSSELSGTPQDALGIISGAVTKLNRRTASLAGEIEKFRRDNADRLLHMYSSLARINRNHVVRRSAMHTERSFYICGWIPDESLAGLKGAIKKNKKYRNGMVVEEDPGLVNMKPPTELKNPRVFRPFETIVKMYGLPAYGEIDPTAFVAITSILMFGMMFGDLGQGLVIFLAGLALARRRVPLGGVFASIGVSSMAAGLVYGNVFGNEDLLPGLFRPMRNQYAILIAGVAVGLAFMAGATVMNIMNGIKEKDAARVLLDRNGIAGVAFHWTILAAGAQYALTCKTFLPVAAVACLAAVAFLAVFFKEPIGRLAERKSFLPKNGVGMFFVQGFFEMLDMVMSMASNTLSFIRVGAFALSHAGLFMAFRSLSELAGRTGGVFVMAFANVLIIALEGLCVGIQCLRLEYYELFNRFFRGEGKAFKPVRRSAL